MHSSALQEKVSQLRKIIGEAIPHGPSASPDTLESEAWRAFQVYESHAPLPLPDDSPRAKCIRDINRIAIWYAWGTQALQRQLDIRGVLTLGTATDETLIAIQEFMAQLEDCAQNGWSSPLEPSAS